MRLASLICSLLFTLAHAAETNWQSLARGLLADDTSTEMAQKKLLETKSLESDLSRGLDKGGEDEQLALLVIRKLQIKNLISGLLDRMTKLDPSQERITGLVLTLVTFTLESDPGDRITDELLKKIPITSSKISPALRLSVISAAINRDKVLAAKDLIELLEDPSYEIRMKSVDLALIGAKKNPMDYIPFFRKSLFVTPFPVRLKSAQAIGDFTLEERKSLKAEVEKCRLTDVNELVRSACRSVQF